MQMNDGLRRAPALAAGLVTAAVAMAGSSAVALAPAGRASASPTPEPIVGQRETVRLISGRAEVRSRGTSAFVALSGAVSLPDESEVDASSGRVQVTVATLQAGQTATAIAYEGRFRLHQEASAPVETHLILSQPLAACGVASRRPKGRKARARSASRDGASAGRSHASVEEDGASAGRSHASVEEDGASAGRSHASVEDRASMIRARASASRSRAAKSRRIWVSDQGGSWGTSGRYVSTTVEGTRWLTADECARSQVQVAEGVVLVHDLIRNRTVSVTAGHEYEAVQEGSALLPPAGQVYMGQTGGNSSEFQRQVGKHPAVYGYFGAWGQPVRAPLAYARGSRARLLLHLSTDIGYGGGAGEEISPAAIAGGASDGYLVQLGRELAESGQPVYIALLPEMNQANNAYCAFTPSGAPRDRAHSSASFRQAFRRAVLIVRGGSVAQIDRRLRALRLPPLHTSQSRLPVPRVAFMWAPQTAGTPDIPANGPAAYYPGSAYVDIVGTDFYSSFPNFRGLASLYAAHPTKPFGFNEWAMWRSGDPGFVRALFAFVASHRRVGLMVYNQGLSASGPFRLWRFPAATQEIRRQLRSSRFPAYTTDLSPSAAGL
jgi:hypothetical protein